MSKLIIAEGPDCCGKSTQIKLLKEALEKEGHKVIITREPGGTNVGEDLRNLVLGTDYEMSKLTEALIFAASRSAHSDAIINYLDEGYIVLCDRHFLTSYVYQGDIAQKVNEPVLEDLKHRMGNNHSMHILLFDIDYSTYEKRMTSRNEGMDRIEKNNANPEIIKNIINGYKNYCLNEPNSIIINANQSIKKVHEETIKNIQKIL